MEMMLTSLILALSSTLVVCCCAANISHYRDNFPIEEDDIFQKNIYFVFLLMLTIKLDHFLFCGCTLTEEITYFTKL
jgi:hypothetical protein